MTAQVGAGRRRGAWHRRADIALLVLALVLTLLTTIILVVPEIVPAVVNDRLDTLILTAALLVSGSVSALAWSRGRVANDAAALLRGSAFAVLALLNGFTLAVALVGADAALGASLEDPGQLPAGRRDRGARRERCAAGAGGDGGPQPPDAGPAALARAHRSVAGGRRLHHARRPLPGAAADARAAGSARRDRRRPDGVPGARIRSVAGRCTEPDRCRIHRRCAPRAPRIPSQRACRRRAPRGRLHDRGLQPGALRHPSGQLHLDRHDRGPACAWPSTGCCSSGSSSTAGTTSPS